MSRHFYYIYLAKWFVYNNKSKIMEKLLLTFLFIALFSCQPVDNTKNYTFSAGDYQYLPTVYDAPERKFLFKNELNETVELSVVSFSQKTEYSGGSFGGSTSHPGNYESLIIELSITSETNTNCIAKNISIYKVLDQSVKIFFENNTMPYPCNSFFILQDIQSPFEYSSMNIGGTTYDKVVTFNYENNSDTPFFHKNYSFDKVYYDLKNGFVGFDDTVNNVHFKLTGN